MTDPREKLCGEQALRSHDDVLGNSSHECDVDQHVEHRDKEDRNRGGDLDSLDWAPDFRHGVKGVGVTDETPDDYTRSICQIDNLQAGSIKATDHYKER